MFFHQYLFIGLVVAHDFPSLWQLLPIDEYHVVDIGYEITVDCF